MEILLISEKATQNSLTVLVWAGKSLPTRTQRHKDKQAPQSRKEKKRMYKVTPEVGMKQMILKYIYKFTYSTSMSYRFRLICIQAIDIETMFTF